MHKLNHYTKPFTRTHLTHMHWPDSKEKFESTDRKYKKLSVFYESTTPNYLVRIFFITLQE